MTATCIKQNEGTSDRHQLAVNFATTVTPSTPSSTRSAILVLPQTQKIVDVKISVRIRERIVYTTKLLGFKSFQIQSSHFTAPFNNMVTLKFKAQPTNAFFATVNQMFDRLLSASDYCRARGNHIVVHSSENEAVFGRSRKLGRPVEHLIDGSEKRICRSTF